MTYKIKFTKLMQEQLQDPKPPKSFSSYQLAYMYGIGRWGSGTHLGWCEYKGIKKEAKERTSAIGWYVEGTKSKAIA